MSNRKTFCSVERSACGQSEMWNHDDDHQMKFSQFGWRCTNSESGYRHGVKIGNWSEEFADFKELRKCKTIPSQYSSNYYSTYENDYDGMGSRTPPAVLINLKRMPPHAFPSHQPILDTVKLKRGYAGWETTSRQSYPDPRLRKAPLGSPPVPAAEQGYCQTTGGEVCECPVQTELPVTTDIEIEPYVGVQTPDRPS